MADLTPKTVGELPEASSLSDSDLFAVSAGGASKKVLFSTVKNAFGTTPISKGGTGATSAEAARNNFGLTFSGNFNSAIFNANGASGMELGLRDSNGNFFGLSILPSALSLSFSTDGGSTWQNAWSFKPPKKLWTNPSPTSSFSAQDVSVESGYDSVFIVFKLRADSTEYFTGTAIKDLPTDIGTFWTYRYVRTVTFDGTKVTFSNGFGGNYNSPIEPQTGDPSYAIPVYIFGLNGFSV